MINHLLIKIEDAQKEHGKLIEEELNILNSGKKLREKELTEACEKTEKISSKIRVLKADLYKHILNTSNDSNLVILTISENKFSEISYDDRLKIFALFEYYKKLNIYYDESKITKKIKSIYFDRKCSMDEIIEILRTDYRDL